MPRSKYPALQPILKKFAEVNKVPGGDDGGTCLEGLVQGLRSRNGLSCQGLRLLGGWATTRGFRFQNPQGLAAFYAGGVLSSPSFPTSVRELSGPPVEKSWN